MKTFTFYSYKGGVGRTLALVNIANRLAEFGKKVCILDFDLEAPGLQSKYAKELQQPIDKGLVDYIYSYAVENVQPRHISDYMVDIRLTNAINTIIIVRQAMLTQVITGKNSHASIGGTYSTQKTVTALISF